MKPILLRSFFALSLLLTHVSLFAEHFMYKPGYASNKVSMNPNHNMSVKMYVGGGTSKHSRNGLGEKGDLLNLYGHEKSAYLLKGVDLTPLTGNLLLLGQDLQAKDLTNKSALYGNISFAGKINTFSTGISFCRQITDHFAMKVVIPFRRFDVKDVTATNLTPANEIDGDAIQATANFKAILKAYGLNAGDVKESLRMGDIQMFNSLHFMREGDDKLGEAHLSLGWGMSLPTARQRKLDEAFYIPMGNNGHVGSNVSVDAHVNVHTYATVSGHFGAEMFLKHDGLFRMKTVEEQNGFIKLASGMAREKLGHKFDVNGGICLHNESREYALGLQYRYERQGKSTLKPFDAVNFTEAIVNSDEMLKSWDRHNIVVKLAIKPEWDDMEHGCMCPRFMVHFTKPIKGKRILNTCSFGGALGLDFTWEF